MPGVVFHYRDSEELMYWKLLHWGPDPWESLEEQMELKYSAKLEQVVRQSLSPIFSPLSSLSKGSKK